MSTTWEKYLGSKSKVGKIAQGVTNAVGGKGITDYAGGKGSKRGLAMGVANVAMTVGTGGAGILRAGAKRVAGKTIAKKVTENALDRKYRIQDAYDYGQRAAKNAKKKK